MARRVEDACKQWLNDWAKAGKKVNLEPGVSLTSCNRRTTKGKLSAFMIGGKGWACDRGMGLDGASAKSLLYHITHKSEDDGHRGTATAIPRGWLIAQGMLDALAESRYDVLQTLWIGQLVRQVELHGWPIAILSTALRCYCRHLLPCRDPVPWVLQLLETSDIPTVEDDVDEQGKSETAGMVMMKDLEDQWRKVVQSLQTDYNILIPHPNRALQGTLLIR